MCFVQLHTLHLGRQCMHSHSHLKCDVCHWTLICIIMALVDHIGSWAPIVFSKLVSGFVFV